MEIVERKRGKKPKYNVESSPRHKHSDRSDNSDKKKKHHHHHKRKSDHDEDNNEKHRH
jgi:hypothetical protein